MKNAPALAALFALVACPTAGHEIDPGQLATLQPGVATEQEVVARLGEPTTRGADEKRNVILGWTWSHAQVRAATFIPVVGVFAGGADSQSKSIIADFGPDHRLLRWRSVSGQIGVGMMN